MSRKRRQTDQPTLNLFQKLGDRRGRAPGQTWQTQVGRDADLDGLGKLMQNVESDASVRMVVLPFCATA